jgi:alkylation response protein AidB-like acyl-CoA dehydrogenase
VSDELRALRESVRALLARHSDPVAAVDTPLGYDDKLWSLLCEQIGVGALAIPERFGGLGAGMAEVCVVQEELGATLTPTPHLGSAILCGQALLATGDDEACERLLPGIADGSRTAAFVVGDGYVLDGDTADVLLVASRAGLFEVDPDDVTRTRLTTMDQTIRLADVTLGDAPLRRLGTGSYPLSRVRDLAIVALAAEQVGAAARALEITVEYSKQRHQFGRPIGGFQALKHRMADMFVRVEAARSALHAALTSVSSESSGDDFATHAAVARIVCSESFQFVAAEMIQLHGGIAITWEHDAHRFFKHAHSTAHLFGTPESYLPSLE